MCMDPKVHDSKKYKQVRVKSKQLPDMTETILKGS